MTATSSSFSLSSMVSLLVTGAFFVGSWVIGSELEFNRDIRPILSENCFFCHGPDEADRKGGLRLDTEEGAGTVIVPGDADASELVFRIEHGDPDELMPPPKSSRRLSREEKETLRRWIEQGARWQNHWAFEPVQNPLEDDPGGSKIDAENHPIDRFIGDRLEEMGLGFSPEASKETLLRRVTLDLTGVPPTIDELEAFLADRSPDAYEKVVNRLLKSPRYAERMTWQWLEASRYADTDGYQNDGPRDMWRWRDWVLQAYAANMPFDRFTIEQLAGDLLPDATLDQKIATGFNRNHRYNSEAGLVLEEFLLENAVDRVDTTSTVWMGMTMGCARCHDHKYDPLSIKEYYQLISFFDAVPESGRAIKFGNSEPWIKAPTPEQVRKLENHQVAVSRAESVLAGFDEKIETLMASIDGDAFPGKPVVSRGLDHRFAVDEAIRPDGTSPVTVRKEGVEGLICNGRFSITFEMTPDRVDGGAVLSNEKAATTRQGIFVEFREGHLRFAIVSRWIAGVAMLETVEKLAAGQTYEVALTNDGTQRVSGMRIYIDGKEAKTREIHNTNSNKGGRKQGGPMLVGGSRHLGNWKGEVRDLRFYTTRTLEPGEVRLIASPTLRQKNLEYGGFGEEVTDAWKKLWDAKEARLAYEDSIQTTMVMLEGEKKEPTRIRVRGEYHNKGEAVESAVPAVFPPLPDGAPRNRLGLARWLVSGDHPLTARVTVNRYWQLLFGTGLVKTAEDFGAQGDLPTHPELLDWLAHRFVQSGWDVKGLLRTIVMSRTYRQSSKVTSDLRERDPGNQWLARAPRMKLPGNVLRDQALFASGLLIEEMGGPSVKPYQPANLWREASNARYTQDEGADLYRRSLYTYWKRTLAPPAMAVLDTADREWCSVKPKSTNTPLQALTLLNETAFFEAARKLGERMLQEGGDSVESRIEFAFRKVLGRSPGEREVAILTSGWGKYLAECESDPEKARQLQTIGESRMTPGLDPVTLGAGTALANVILNLEEASVRE